MKKICGKTGNLLRLEADKVLTFSRKEENDRRQQSSMKQGGIIRSWFTMIAFGCLDFFVLFGQAKRTKE